jgi:hypothetical protein
MPFLFLLPLIFVASIIANHWVDIPFWDEWNVLVRLYRYIIESNPGFWGLFWEEHFSHRLILLKLIYLINFKVFSGSNLPLLVFNFAVQSLQLLLFTRYIKSAIVPRSTLWWCCAVACSWFLFSPQMGSVWLWPMLLQQTLTALFFSWAVLSVVSSHVLWKTFVLAILCSMSSANGLAVWPVIVTLFLLKKSWKQSLTTLMLSVIVIICYLHGLRMSGEGVLEVTLMHQVRYFFIFLGGILSGGGVHKAIAAGALGFFAYILCLFFALSSKENRGLKLSFLAVGLLAISSALGGAVLRIALEGEGQALAERYMPLSATFWCALCITISLEFKDLLQGKFALLLRPALLVFIGYFLVFCFPWKPINPAPFPNARLQDLRLAEMSFRENVFVVNTKTDYGRLYPDVKHLLGSVKFIKHNHLSLFNTVKRQSLMGLSLAEVELVEDKSITKVGSVNLAPKYLTEVNVCDFGFRRGVLLEGMAAVDGSQVEKLYIVTANDIIVGLGQIEGQPRSRFDVMTLLGVDDYYWSAFVDSSQIKSSENIRVLIKFRGSKKLIALEDSKIVVGDESC